MIWGCVILGKWMTSLVLVYLRIKQKSHSYSLRHSLSPWSSLVTKVFVCMCIYECGMFTCSSGCACVRMHGHMEVRGWHGIFLRCSPLFWGKVFQGTSSSLRGCPARDLQGSSALGLGSQPGTVECGIMRVLRIWTWSSCSWGQHFPDGGPPPILACLLVLRQCPELTWSYCVGL